MEPAPKFVVLDTPIENAELAQLVERNLAKVEVAGSSPVFRSKADQISDRLFLCAPVLDIVLTFLPEFSRTGKSCIRCVYSFVGVISDG